MSRDTRFRHLESGYTVDVTGILTRKVKGSYLVNRDRQKVKPIHLENKTIVLIISKYLLDFDAGNPDRWLIRDMADSYMELKTLSGVEFVFVPLDFSRSDLPVNPFARKSDPVMILDFKSKNHIYNKLLPTMPWPALKFHDIPECGAKVAQTFGIDASFPTPFWVIIDPTSKVVATKSMYPHLFKFFGGAELHPFTAHKIRTLCANFDYDPWADYGLGPFYRWECRKQIIRKWDEQLKTILSSNGAEVSISSLEGNVIGLYFCENIPHPLNMELIKKVYNEAKEHKHAFEIVQINFHYHFFDAIHSELADLDKEVLYEDIKWYRLPFKDPSCRKLQRMFKCKFDHEFSNWDGDCLVIIDPRKVDSTEVLFEFSGVEIFEEYGIRGYPFTRQTLYKIEREKQKKELTLQSVFAQGCRFIRSDGCDGGDVSQLIGKKRVLVLLGGCEGHCNAFLDGSGSDCKMVHGEAECKSRGFLSMLKSKYLEQLNDEKEENKFQVVYVSMDYSESSFKECIKDMPWLVHPHCREFSLECHDKIFKRQAIYIGAAVFGIDGELIAKEYNFCYGWGENEPQEFPFVSQDWDGWIKGEVEGLCQLGKYD